MMSDILENKPFIENEPQVENIAPWNPSIHSFRGNLLFYEPGHRLIYEHRFDPTVVVWRFIAALVLGWLLGLLFRQISWTILATVSFVGIVELVRWKSGRYDSTRWEWDWRQGYLHEIVGEDRFDYDLSEVQEIVLRLSRREHRWSSYLSGSGKQHRFYSFCAQTLIAGPDPKPFVVASTEELQLHPDDVEYMGLCFASMLAQNLQVPLRVIDEKGVVGEHGTTTLSAHDPDVNG